MSAQRPEAVAPQVGDTLTVTGTVKRVSVTGHMALVEITGGTIWVPLAGEGRMLDPAVKIIPAMPPTVTRLPNRTCPHHGDRCAL